MTQQALHLPAHFLTTLGLAYLAQNPHRPRVEVGGYLLARPNAPNVVVAATGPA